MWLQQVLRARALLQRSLQKFKLLYKIRGSDVQSMVSLNDEMC